ncbi:Uncharacterized membrane protein YcaP, DUF421 family [Gracilibacillus orientalis]|uniref:Uncharacterized membrane protein YcaP, DUF421 family n=1 Tax=Gracilibacillus orientalis TaxID=334253 RepID=A0A1I4JWQ8_9BACI|nr:DUF421 domain-containing protein [Gracilibacillus orientalis]SFL70536.1 Uncharacterized membrane protein YcaP, DUF421 family [Gracilibacillus orientalis]
MSDILIIVGRVLTILPILLIITIFMGKRAIGELPVFDFLVIITLSSVVGADIADPNINHVPTITAVILIGLLQKIVSYVKLANRRIGRLITFEPTIVVYDGTFLQRNLKDTGFSIDNILQMLRDKGVFDSSEVEIAIIEANGSLSVLKKPEKNPVTVEDLQIEQTISNISYPVIVEGIVHTKVLAAKNLNEEWLQAELRKIGITNSKDVFFASINLLNEMNISLYDDQFMETPPIQH